MSTIKVSAIQDLSGGTDVDVPNGAKVWVNFNGSGTVAIREDYNVTSITDNGTGDYTLNFTNALVDANYACGGMAGISNGAIVANRFVLTPPTTTAARFQVFLENGPAKDEPWTSVLIFR